MSYMPELRKSLVKAAERQTAHPTGDEQRSGGRRRPSLGGVATLLATATAIAVAVVALTVIPRGHSGPPAPAGGAAPNATVARAAATRLLEQLVLPAGAVKTGLVRGTPADLWSPSDLLQVRHRVDVYGVWRLPGGPRQAIRFIQAHRPAGSQIGVGGESRGSGPSGREQVQSETVVLNFSGNLKTIIWRELAVQADALPGGGTALRADAEAGWLIPRPAAEQIPADADRVVIGTLTQVDRHKLLRHTRTVTSPQQIQAIAALLNGLARSQPGSRCANASGVRMRFAFYGRGHLAPLALLAYNPFCNRFAVTIDGRPQPDLTFGFPGGDVLQEVARMDKLYAFGGAPVKVQIFTPRNRG